MNQQQELGLWDVEDRGSTASVCPWLAENQLESCCFILQMNSDGQQRLGKEFTFCGLSYLSARGHIPCGRAGRTGQVPAHWSPVSLRCLHCCWGWICTGTLGRSRQALGCAHCTCGKVSVDCLTLSVASFLLPLCTHMKM